MKKSLFDHIEKLPVLLEVVRVRSIRGASKSLGVSQPGVSRAIQILEECVSERLLLRSQNGVIPTELGIKLCEVARKITKEVNEFEFSSTEKESLTRRIKLGTYESIAVYFFPDFLSQNLKQPEKYIIDLLTSDSKSLEQKLKQNLVDAIISVGASQSKALISRKLFDDYYGFFTHPGLKITSATPVIIFPSASDQMGVTVAEHIEESVFKRNPQFLCESFEPIKALAKNKLGVAILPLRVAESSVKHNYLVEYRPPESKAHRFGKHTVYYSYLKHRAGDSDLLNLYGRIEDFHETRRSIKP
jgi:DNA-binding transcriptional LysR family regulator